MEQLKSSIIAASGALWFALAFIVGGSGLQARLHPPFPQLVLITLTGCLVVAGMYVPRLRLWASSIDLRVIVALHLTRFIGAYFLALNARGELPDAFAIPAGWGDIVVATSAAVLLLTVSPSSRRGRMAYLAWNVLGTVDILAVVGKAAAQGMSHPESMSALGRLPLCLLPTFLVPLIIASHILLFVRLKDRPQAGG